MGLLGNPVGTITGTIGSWLGSNTPLGDLRLPTKEEVAIGTAIVSAAIAAGKAAIVVGDAVGNKIAEAIT